MAVWNRPPAVMGQDLPSCPRCVRQHQQVCEDSGRMDGWLIDQLGDGCAEGRAVVKGKREGGRGLTVSSPSTASANMPLKVRDVVILGRERKQKERERKQKCT